MPTSVGTSGLDRGRFYQRSDPLPSHRAPRHRGHRLRSDLPQPAAARAKLQQCAGTQSLKRFLPSCGIVPS